MKENLEIKQAAADQVSLVTNFPPTILAHYCILGVPRALYFLMSTPKACSRSQSPSPLDSTFIHARVNDSYHLLKLAVC